VLDRAALPIAPETKTLCRELRLPLDHFLVSSGEDYELLFTSRLSSIVVRHPTSTRIGRVEEGSGVYLLDQGKLRRLRATGYDHLR
jgi:thiamine monophosphate kinase